VLRVSVVALVGVTGLCSVVFRHSFGLHVGVVGSWSLAEEAQTFVHRQRGFAVPRGSANQLHNEIGVVAVYELSWRWPHHERRVGLGWDFIPHAGIVTGNVYDYVNAGAELRVGFNLPDDFGTPGIEPGATTSTPAEGDLQATRARILDVGAYLFARVDGRVVARNIFLDGNTFRDSASVERKAGRRYLGRCLGELQEHQTHVCTRLPYRGVRGTKSGRAVRFNHGKL
jgi:lipid A 3-O-deacylase